MRSLSSDATESHFSQVMSLITRMYKETAIAKVSTRLSLISQNYPVCVFNLLKFILLARTWFVL